MGKFQFMGIDLFFYNGMDEYAGWKQGYDCQWVFDSMKIYDGMAVTIDADGIIEIENEDGDIKSAIYAYQIEEYWEALLKVKNELR